MGASWTPGPWSGSMAYTDNSEEGVRILISHKKWGKVRYIWAVLGQGWNSMWVDHKDLEKSRGFLIYVSRTYPPLNPFMEGFYFTIDDWRPKRDDEGWRLTQYELEASKGSYEESGVMEVQESADQAPPVRIQEVTRLKDDVDVLRLLTEAESPLCVGSGPIVRLASCIVLGLPRAGGGGELILRKEFDMRRMEQGHSEGVLELPGAEEFSEFPHTGSPGRTFGWLRSVHIH
jgi:hypothetical protein